MNKKIPFSILLILLFCHLSQAGDIRGGNMRVEQLSQKTVRVSVNFYTRLHADPVSLELCWGDGNCEQWGTVLQGEWPEIDTRQYQLQTFHTYTQPGEYILRVESCCWTGDISNGSPSEDTPFVLENMFAFSGDDQELRNTTPDFNPSFNICSLNACSHIPEVVDEEGDSLVWKLCLPDLPGYFPLDEVAPSPLNNVFLNPDTGGLSWVSPPFEGFFSHVLCMTEYRDGTLLSENEYFVLLVVNNQLPTEEVLLPEFRLRPNPTRDLLYLDGLNEEWKDANCQIFHSNGQLKSQQKNSRVIDTDNWSGGLYFLVLEKEGKRVRRKFIKSH